MDTDMHGYTTFLKPGDEDLRHFHQVNRARRGVHEAFDRMDDNPRVG